MFTSVVSAWRRPPRALSSAGAAVVLTAGGAPAVAGAPSLLRIGAIFPLTGGTAADAGDEYLGALIAVQMVNAGGGVQGRQISLDVRSVDSVDQIAPAV